jgi:hypothetical protein
MDNRIDSTRFLDAVQGIYRLFKVATFHRLDNDAVTRAIELTMASIRAFADSNEGLSMLFARDTVIVNGRLLQAPPAVYELAMEFGGFLVGAGINSFHIDGDAEESDLRALLWFFRERLHSNEDEQDTEFRRSGSYRIVPDNKGAISPHVRLRAIKDHLLLGLEDPRLSTFERVLLTYALAIRVIRQLLVDSAGGTVAIPPFFKRVSRQLALADYGSRPALLDVLLAPSRSDDRARHAVNSAIVAAAMVRRLVRDDVILSRVAFEAMLLDFGFGEQATVGLADERTRPMFAAALAQIRTGELRGDAVERTLVAFEATSLLGGNAPTQVYFGAHAPSLDARIVATARTFVDSLAQTYSAGASMQTAFDAASGTTMSLAVDELGDLVVALLHDAIGLIPVGSAVRLERGCIGLVTSCGSRPSLFDRPRVLLVRGPDGALIEPVQVDLAEQVATEMFGCVETILESPDEHVLRVREAMFGLPASPRTGAPAVVTEAIVATSAPAASSAPVVTASAPVAAPSATIQAQQAPEVSQPVVLPAAPALVRSPVHSPSAAVPTPSPTRTPGTDRTPAYVSASAVPRATPTPAVAPRLSQNASPMTGAEALRAALAAAPTPEAAPTNAPRYRAPTGDQRAVSESGSQRAVPDVRRPAIAARCSQNSRAIAGDAAPERTLDRLRARDARLWDIRGT